MKVLLLHPTRDPEREKALAPYFEDLVRDLELDVILETMAQGDQFLHQVCRYHLLRSLDDPEVILYRQEVLRDCLEHPQVVRAIYQTTLDFMEKKSRWWFLSSTRHSSPSLVLSSALHILEASLDSLRNLRRLAEEEGKTFRSKGFVRLFSTIKEELSDEYLKEVEGHINRLKFPKGTLFMVQLGMGNQGVNYQLCQPRDGGENWLKRILSARSPLYSFTIHPRDDHGLKVLGEIRDAGLEKVAGAVSRAAHHIESFFKALREATAFYLGGFNLYQELYRLKEPLVLPVPLPRHERRLSAAGLYDAALALTMKKKVVGNDLKVLGKDLVIITGPNRGGKTTFLRSLGQAQLMMQCGMFVPARAFTSPVCQGLFTHFTREEDRNLERGKFDEELERMSALIDHLTPHALVLLNESLSSTNDREGSELAKQIVKALIDKDIRVFYVTHLYEFARSFLEREKEKVLFLRAERLPDGTRTFKLKEGFPLATSYGIDLYKKIFGNETGTTHRVSDSPRKPS